MGWTTPRTWVDGELENAAIFNPHVRDNLGYLLNRPNQKILRNNAADYTTSSASFVDVDATNLLLTLVMSGGAALITVAGMVANVTNSASIRFDIAVDGVRYSGATNGIASVVTASAGTTVDAPISFAILVTGLSAASHAFKLQWLTSSGTATLRSTAAQFVNFTGQEVS